MAQIARNLTDAMDGFLKEHKFLVCDRDTKFTDQFKAVLQGAGVEISRTPKNRPHSSSGIHSIASIPNDVWRSFEVSRT